VATRRIKGTTPPVFVRDGKPVPPSPDVAVHGLAQLIGQACAYHLGELLGPALSALAAPRRHMCIVCTARLKAEAKAYEVKLANAVAAAEEQPEAPDTRVTESFTHGLRGPVCWACFDQELDGPFGFDPPVD
jgi:hypothetical protein